METQSSTRQQFWWKRVVRVVKRILRRPWVFKIVLLLWRLYEVAKRSWLE